MKKKLKNQNGQGYLETRTHLSSTQSRFEREKTHLYTPVDLYVWIQSITLVGIMRELGEALYPHSHTHYITSNLPQPHQPNYTTLLLCSHLLPRVTTSRAVSGANVVGLYLLDLEIQISLIN